MGDIKKVKNFIYQYQDDETVTVAYVAVMSNTAGQMLVNEKMKYSGAERTGKYRDLIFNRLIYVGVVFKDISEIKLVKVLKSN